MRRRARFSLRCPLSSGFFFSHRSDMGTDGTDVDPRAGRDSPPPYDVVSKNNS